MILRVFFTVFKNPRQVIIKCGCCGAAGGHVPEEVPPEEEGGGPQPIRTLPSDIIHEASTHSQPIAEAPVIR